MKLGILKETKTPPDERVPLSPLACKQITETYPNIEIIIQSSDIRAFKDEEYTKLGLTVQEDVSECDVLMGVKEVKMEYLIPNKTYFFFSHTIKEQPYNRELLLDIMKKNIQLIDYETLTSPRGGRLLGFGRYAGIVGAYNTFLAYGKKYNVYNLKAAHDCEDYNELKKELSKVKLPANYKIILTGDGRVGHGAKEIINELKIKNVCPTEFLGNDFNEAVYTQLSVKEYNERIDGKDFEKRDFYTKPNEFKSVFCKYAKVADMYIACHYWDAEAPFLFTRKDAKSKDFNIKIIGDISCDIDGPVASTIRPSTIEKPLYGYLAETESEVDFMNENAIGVMAVDNLPCELPKDASCDFGSEFMAKILPSLAGEDSDTIIERARMTKDGKLTKYYAYLQDYVDGVND